MSWLEGLAEPDWRVFHSNSEVQNIAKSALALLKEDCHNCKLECLLQKYDELKEKYDALLKEQDAVKPKIDAFGHPYCPKCKILVYETWEFCPHCGKKMKWE